ncbi:helicase-associated domain-containing protein [Gordonia sp. CPCC 205515]|uniref:helicase-associated domain-containing protein n=1 Tax=Gordonia sp. CPCC 205515 TaxID=3140791 RepID=UPI003AF3B081
MSSDSQDGSLADDLASRTDDELTDLLVARPDLASPPPAGTKVLASRALSSASSALAGEDLDLLSVAVLETVVDAGTDTTGPVPAPVALTAIQKALAGRASKPDIRARVDLLRRRALLWGSDKALLTGAHAPAALPWRAHHLTGPLGAVTTEDLQTRLEALDEQERGLVETLSRGPSLGRSRDAASDADPTKPVPRLVAAGLLARVDEQTVELPPMIGQLLRGEPPLRTDDLHPPALHDADTKPRFSAAAVEAAAGGEALELIRHTTSLLRSLGATPAAVLRSGALGVRELRRLAKVTGLTQQRMAFIVELLGYTRLIDAGFPEPPPPDDTGELAFAPTPAADSWLHQTPERQWLVLLEAWLEMPRRPWQVGEPDRDGNAFAALSGDLHDAYAPVQRRAILATLEDGKPAVPVTDIALATALHWRQPRQIRRYTLRIIDETLREARELGLVAHGAVTSVGRTSLIGDDAEAVLLDAMRAALPEPVDHFLAQADLTLTVPGPMTAELAEQVELVADLESGGAASVYRVSENSVRRALDAGRGSSELIAMFTTHSRTPVPQSLTYLIEDVARKHGQLRVGVASAFIRCEDPTTLAAVLRSEAAEPLALRALAPTVAVSPADVRDVIDRLRSAGFAPAGEDSSGSLVDLRERGSRVSVARQRRHAQPRRPVPSPDQLRMVIARMRSSDRADGARSAGPAAVPVRASGSGESATALIQLALRAKRRLRVDYVDAHGSATRHLVTPTALGAGQLVAVDTGTQEEERFSLHRITSVELLEN